MNRLRFAIYMCALFTFFSLTLFASSQAKKPPEINARESASFSLRDRPAPMSAPAIQKPVENPWQNLTAHRTLSSGFSSEDQLLSAAAADFNGDGVTDLVLASAHAGRGLVALYPGDYQSRFSLKNDRSPFLSATSRTDLAEPATWIGAGDFNADGHADVVAVRKGSANLYWLEGDGHGNFRNIHTLTLDGPVTAMVVGEMNRADGLPDVVVAIQGRKGPQILVFQSPLGALQANPEKINVSEPVTSLALGQLDDSYEYDLAAAAGSHVLIIHGRDRRLTQGGKRQAEVKPAVIDSIAFPSPVSSLAIGNFVGDNKQDIAALSASGSLQILERDGTGWKQEDVKAALSGSSTLLAGFVSGGPHQNLISSSAQEGLHALNSSSGSLSMAALEGATGSVAALPMRLNADALEDLVVVRQDSPDPLVLLSSPAATFTVNSTGDASDPTINGICDVGGGVCTLRAALQEANATAAADVINFNIPGSAPFIIAPASALPPIISPVTIDARTQPGASTGTWPPTLAVRINGAPAGSYGLIVDTGGSGTLIAGLVINNCPAYGIFINSSNDNLIQYNFLGTNVAGTTALPNDAGVVIQGTSDSNLVGGTTAGERNLVSGNTSLAGVIIWAGPSFGNVVEGNFFGTDPTGSVSLPNAVVADVGVAFNTSNNTILDNLISTNTGGHGIILQGTSSSAVDVTGTFIAGNLIGTDASGTVGLGNVQQGIRIFNSSFNTIGGVVPSLRNVLSGNGFWGVGLDGGGDFENFIQGNFIGTDASGTVAIPNANYGILTDVASDTIIGGTVPGTGNVVSGNTSEGIYNYASGGTEILGNLVGTNASGTAALGNGDCGILSENSFETIVAGTDLNSRNVVSGNANIGVLVYDDSFSTVQGNFIGTDAGGTGGIPNYVGVRLDGGSADSMIGGNTPQAGNVVSGNLWDGIQNLAATGAVIQGNLIGTTASGGSPLPNGGSGIYLADGTTTIGGRAVGEGNLVAFNALFGIAIDSVAGPNPMLGNSIFNNGLLEVDLARDGVDVVDTLDTDTGPNGKQNYPFLAIPTLSGGMVSLFGVLFSSASAQFALDFYSSPSCDPSGYGGGKNYLGSYSVGTDVSGTASFTATFSASLNPGDFVTAMATDAAGNTSEFSQCSCYMPLITASSNSPVCSGQPLHLYVNPAIPGATYSWTGPNGFSSITQNPTIDNATVAASGTYTSFAFVNACSTGSQVAVTVNPTPALFPLSLPNGVIGDAYNQSLSAVGGTAPFTFAVTLGSLPTGLTLASDGTLSGTPSATGDFDFVVTLTDANGCGQSLSYTIHIACATITLTPDTLPQLLPNVFYDAAITPTGGVAPYTFAVTSGSLPTGLTLDPNTGELSGTTTDTGNFSFTVTVTDAAGCTGSHDYTLQGCLFCADFEDGILDTGWTYTGSWSESGGNMIGNGTSGKALAVASPVFAGCSTCSFEARIQTAGGIGNKVSFFGWYQDSKNNVELMMKQETGRWLLKQHINGVVVTKGKAVMTINPNQSYLVHMAFDGTTFTVSIDGSPAITLTAAGTASGTGAFAGKKTTVTVGYLHVN